ncbi:MAG: YicC family protein [Bacteroidia bacterium]|nr:YicC family protein [Bacteroidota bacterium]MCZ2131167.1 YicC family protein [Bacteroidia bacterium]
MSNLRSMTGFGSVESANKNISVKVEIRSLNGKFFECNLRTSKIFRDKETEIRQWAADKIGRGSIQINVNVDYINQDLLSSQLSINHKIAKHYKQQIDALTAELNMANPNMFEYLMQLPEVIKINDPKTGDEDWNLAKNTLDKAFEQFDNFRLQEGKALARNLKEHALTIQQHLQSIILLDDERKASVTSKLQKAIEELNEKVKLDPTRFEYELLYYLEKLDIGEEISRLHNHIHYFIETIDNEATGKKLGFISQEMGREINTLGSKANYFTMQKYVVEMKDVLEKIKEQVLNAL